MNKISANIIADSISPQGHRIISYILTYPRMIHAEVMTHRMFSRNAASSRAIPFNKMVKMVEEDPFIPIAWQKDHKGMQGNEYLSDEKEIKNLIYNWLFSKSEAVARAKVLNTKGITKQLCNRLLEPFMWYTALVTATEYDNFFELRCPKYKLVGIGEEFAYSRKDWLSKMKFSSTMHPSQYPHTEQEWWKISESGAEIHIQALAEAMWDARNESITKKLQPGEWHIPFDDKIEDLPTMFATGIPDDLTTSGQAIDLERIKIAVARCARLSYLTFDGEIDYVKDIALHNMLLKSKHMSPFEHCAKAMTDKEYRFFIKGQIEEDESNNNKLIYGWCNNFRGFIPYRYLIENNG